MALDARQAAFAQDVARTGDVAGAGRRSGYSRAGSDVARGAKVAREIERQQRHIVRTELLPKAVRTLDALMDHESGFVRLGAAKEVVRVVERTGILDAAEGGELHALTADQLGAVIAKLEASLAAGPVIDLHAEEADIVGAGFLD